MTNPYTDLPHETQKLASTSLSTVVGEFEPTASTESNYQSEAELEKELIATLVSQGYEHAPIHDEEALVTNLRSCVEQLNNVQFNDGEWQRLLTDFIAPSTDSVLDKTRRIQHEGGVYDFEFDSNERANIKLIDSDNWSRNKLQVINQYKVATSGGPKDHNRYDVTILVNGLPMVHLELKRRGVQLKEAFNQIRRYGRDSFSTGHRLFGYVHIFVISNGTLTKYYSNTTRERQIKGREGKGNTSNSYEFTMCCDRLFGSSVVTIW
ncbi:type I restriction endonuclease [Corynebacterium macclintockiae]|uniref:type I restriction endonuclease n=1 Tax=Corynebacterium macclintockiae TaxID=2913501 RepID=UPI003EC5241E